MHNFKGAIFDLDGTLLDSMWIWEQIDMEFLGRRGLTVAEDYLAAITPMHFYQAAEYTISRSACPRRRRKLSRNGATWRLDAYRHRIGLKPYAKEYLLYLKEQGVKLSVATASSDFYLHAGARAQRHLQICSCVSPPRPRPRVGKAFRTCMN